MRSRLAPLRNRRDASGRRAGITEAATTDDDTNTNTAVVPTQQLSDGGNSSNSSSNSTDSDSGVQRTRRDTPGCVVNYESNRQLLVGCSQSNVIEVKPHCNDDGDEGNCSCLRSISLHSPILTTNPSTAGKSGEAI